MADFIGGIKEGFKAGLRLPVELFLAIASVFSAFVRHKEPTVSERHRRMFISGG